MACSKYFIMPKWHITIESICQSWQELKKAWKRIKLEFNIKKK